LQGKQVEQERPKRSWRFYLIGSISFLLTALTAIAVAYFWEEIQHAKGYGYVGAFLVSVLGGVTIIPIPSLLVIFTLGRVMKPLFGPEFVGPVFVGLVSGFGEALGGITVYLTGAGAGTIWSRLRPKQQTLEYPPDPHYDMVRPAEPKFWSKGESFYNRLAHWVGGRGGSWVVFIASAMPISPFYFAGLAAGTLKMGLLRFFLVSWAGKTIKGLIVASAGYWGLYFLPQWTGG